LWRLRLYRRSHTGQPKRETTSKSISPQTYGFSAFPLPEDQRVTIGNGDKRGSMAQARGRWRRRAHRTRVYNVSAIRSKRTEAATLGKCAESSEFTGATWMPHHGLRIGQAARATRQEDGCAACCN